MENLYDQVYRKNILGESDPQLSECGFNHPVFEDTRKRVQETLQFQDNMIEIQDGVEQCRKCGSFKTLSSAKQTRSADEGATVFTQCLLCKHRSVKNS